MLINHATLLAIIDGTVDTLFRRWKSARVRAGTQLRTRVGLIEVEKIDALPLSKVTAKDARRAGYDSRAALLEELEERQGEVFRIRARFAGADPRIALRQQSRVSKAELTEIQSRLAKMEARRAGPWTKRVLRLIDENPAIRAPDLAKRVGQETQPFKRDVRKLKELGLTESLEVGYRLSPRGRAVLQSL